MEADQGKVELGDDEVLVVAGITDECHPLAVARLIEAVRAVDRHHAGSGVGLDEQRRGATVDGLVEQVRRCDRTASVETVEIESRDAEVAQRLGVLAAGEGRCRVERHVVIEELPEEREARGAVRVVGVVDALGRIGDERDRVREVVGSVHRAARSAELGEGIADERCVGGERRKAGEQSAEAALVVEGRTRCYVFTGDCAVWHARLLFWRRGSDAYAGGYDDPVCGRVPHIGDSTSSL